MRSLLALILVLLFAPPAAAAVVRVPVAIGSSGPVASAPGGPFVGAAQVQALTLLSSPAPLPEAFRAVPLPSPVAAAPAEALFAQKLAGLAPEVLQKHPELSIGRNLPGFRNESGRYGSLSDPALRDIVRHSLVSEKSMAMLTSAAQLWAQERVSGPKVRPDDEDEEHFFLRNEKIRRDRERPMAQALLGRYERETGARLPQERRERIVTELIDADALRHSDIFGALVWTSLVTTLARQELAIEVGRFLLETKRRVDHVYRRFLPSFHQDDLQEQWVFDLSPALNGHHTSWGSFSEIGLDIDGAWTHANEGEIGPGLLGGRMQRRVSALLILVHERAHHIFDRALPYNKDKEGLAISFTDYDALNEGFAVTLELLAADKMVAAREELGISEQDVRDIREWKRQRLSLLRAKKDHYTFGTLNFWHRILKREGEAGMLRTLSRLRALPSTDLPFAYGSRAENSARGESLIAEIIAD